MTKTSQVFMSRQLTRLIAFNLACLALFVAFCAIMAFGSPSLLSSYGHEHRGASVVGVMILIVTIPGLVELALWKWGRSSNSPSMQR